MENTEFLCDRFDTIAARFKTNSKNTTEEAMTLLDDVSQDNAYSATQWSAVYNITDFSVDVAIDMDYGKVFTFTPENFK